MCTMSLNYPAEVVADQLEPAQLTVHQQAAGPVLAGLVGSPQSLVVLFGSHMLAPSWLLHRILQSEKHV